MGCGSSSTKFIDEQNAPALKAAEENSNNVENIVQSEQNEVEQPEEVQEEQPEMQPEAASEDLPEQQEISAEVSEKQEAGADEVIPSSSHLIDIPLVSLSEKPDFGDSTSLTAKYVNQVWDEVKSKTTESGFAFDLVINSAYENRDSGIGCYAPEADAYTTFAPFFDKVIEEYHGFKPTDNHVSNMDASLLQGENPDPEGQFIVSTRIRVGRNLAGYPLAPGISREQRLEVENRVVEVLNSFEGALAGKYHPLSGMDEETRQQLVDDHFLFKKGDRFLESAGANRDWPEGRGIFHSDDKQFLVWVNEEDELRVISMQNGGDVLEVFTRLATAVNILEEKLTFAHSEHLGYLTSCPTNLGTAMRASVHIKIPLVSQQDNFKDWCKERGLSIRGVDGEHSESVGGIYDISNKRRLGLSEVDCAQSMYNGVVELIAWEKSLQSQTQEAPVETTEEQAAETTEVAPVEATEEVVVEDAAEAPVEATEDAPVETNETVEVINTEEAPVESAELQAEEASAEAIEAVVVETVADSPSEEPVEVKEPQNSEESNTEPQPEVSS